MTTNYGIIYKITNLKNQKCYIGQTKKYYGNKLYGLNGRWKRHISTAKNPNKSGCPYFEAAINKYGSENFKTEILLICDILDRDMFEINMIKMYQSNIPQFGYNISDGGSGVHYAKRITEEFRNKISKTQNKTTKLTGIIPIYNANNSIRGYRASRKINGICFTKSFVNKDITIEEKLNMSKHWLETLKNVGIVSDDKYNRKHDLPHNISYCIDKYTKEKTGYNINIIRNGICYIRSICKKGISMSEKLVIALKIKNEILENLRKNDEVKIQDNPHPSS